MPSPNRFIPRSLRLALLALFVGALPAALAAVATDTDSPTPSPSDTPTATPSDTPTVTGTATPNCAVCQGGLFCDNFESPANSVVSGNWIERSGAAGTSLSVVNGGAPGQVAELNPNGGWHWAIHNAFAAQADEDFEALVTQGGQLGIFVRASAGSGTGSTPDDCYGFQIDLGSSPSTVLIYKIVGGFWFPSYDLATSSVTVANPAHVRLRFKAQGSSLSAYVDGTLVLSASDGDLAAGSIGLSAFSAPARFDELLLNASASCPYPTATSTASPSFTVSPTFSISPTATPTGTPTASPTPNCALCQGGIFCDGFEYPGNSVATSSWTTRTGLAGASLSVALQPSGNAVARLDPAGNWFWAVHSGFPSLGDQDLSASVDGGVHVSLVLRAAPGLGTGSTPDDAYVFQVVNSTSPVQLLIYKILGGGWNPSYDLATGSYSPADPSHMRLRFKALGGQLSASIDGVNVLNAVDFSLASGSFGILCYSSAADFDELVANPGSICLQPSFTGTRTISPTVTPTPSLTASPSPTASPSSTVTCSFTVSPTVTPTANCAICRGGIFCDDFESGGNSVATAQWTSRSGPAAPISVATEAGPNQAAALDPSGDWDWALLNGYAGLTDQDFEALVTAGFQPSIILRAAAGSGSGVTPDDGYFFQVNTQTVPATLRIYKILGGAWNPSYDLASGTAYIPENGLYRMRFSAVGTQLRAYIEGVQVLSAVDSSLGSGTVGLLGVSSSTHFDALLLNPACPGPSPTVTETATPSATPSPSGTITPTPAYASTNLGDLVLGPVPASIGKPLCLYFGRRPLSSRWEIFNSSGERVAKLSFDGPRDNCWDTSGMAPGLYFAKISAAWAAGGTGELLKKIVLVH